jgi:putative tricarboxylic transport membrane protein
MDEINALVQAFAVAASPPGALLIPIGVALGICIGLLPGLRGAGGLAALLPLTASIAQEPGGMGAVVTLVSCMCVGAQYAATILRVLIACPGSGRAAGILTAAATSAFVGTLVAVLVVTFLSPVIAGWALRFGPPEFASLYLLVFCIFVAMSGGHAYKTVTSIVIGLGVGVAALEMSASVAHPSLGLAGPPYGVDVLVPAIGLLALADVFLALERPSEARASVPQLTLEATVATCKTLPRYWAAYLRGSSIGCFMGIVPGGASMAPLVGHRTALDFSARGAEDGLVGFAAAGTAAHAAETSALVPMMALGVPASPMGAVVLAALVTWGLQPGPLLFVEEPDVVWGFIASIYLASVVALIAALAGLPLWAAIMRTPRAVGAGATILACTVGAYTIRGSLFDVGLVGVSGIAGYLLKKRGYPVVPLVVALVLAGSVDVSVRNTVKMYQGDPSILTENGLVAAATALALALLLSPAVGTAFRRRRAPVRT